jgi:small subunit ribosomal protein S7
MRKRAAKKRPLLPDPKFNDQLVTRFVNNLMWDGKKSTAFKVFYDAMEIVETKKNNDEKSSLEVWKDALTNVMPHVEVRSRRVGGATFQIPMQIRPDRKISMAMKWFQILQDNKHLLQSKQSLLFYLQQKFVELPTAFR